MESVAQQYQQSQQQQQLDSTAEFLLVLHRTSFEILEVLFASLCFMYAFSRMLRVRDEHTD